MLRQMLDQGLGVVGKMALILVVVAALVIFHPLWMALLFTCLIGSIGGSTESGRLLDQTSRIFWFMVASALYGALIWTTRINPTDLRPLLPIVITFGWVKWVSVATLLPFFILFGGGKRGEEKQTPLAV